MKPALLLVLGVGDLVALNAVVVPRLLPIAPSEPPIAPSERLSRESRGHAETAPAPTPRLAAAAARSGHPETPAPLYFAIERATIKRDAADVLDGVAAHLAEDPRLTLHVTAHACAAGSDAYNLALSRRRARRVIEYLATHDIDPARIVTTARGERDARSHDPDAREDRRVDLRFEVTP